MGCPPPLRFWGLRIPVLLKGCWSWFSLWLYLRQQKMGSDQLLLTLGRAKCVSPSCRVTHTDVPVSR